jgi:hypothetical protein
VLGAQKGKQFRRISYRGVSANCRSKQSRRDHHRVLYVLCDINEFKTNLIEESIANDQRTG